MRENISVEIIWMNLRMLITQICSMVANIDSITNLMKNLALWFVWIWWDGKLWFPGLRYWLALWFAKNSSLGIVWVGISKKKLFKLFFEHMDFGSLKDNVDAIYRICSFFVLINGVPNGPIALSKGLRQEDPISPYLFLLWCIGG